MKKILTITSCVVLLSSGIAVAAEIAPAGGLSAATATIYGGINATDSASANATLIGKLSKGVKLGAKYSSAGYAIDTKHDSGNTFYGVTHDATAIYKKEVGTTALTAPSAADVSAFSDWTAM
ncbi:MAG: hypothetical protein A2075_15535 [Geobacteraceae bacterium GWC2_58_44]|nr:MAG: hypothetical protein A2075_15535 [Geobacteraceae bacterium GWC2_58_44]HBG05997.1 hypothetical protein [Geobacter sp.]